jgi:hypothetical protein
MGQLTGYINVYTRRQSMEQDETLAVQATARRARNKLKAALLFVVLIDFVGVPERRSVRAARGSTGGWHRGGFTRW